MNLYWTVFRNLFSTKKGWIVFLISFLTYLLLTSLVLNYKQFTSFYQTSVSLLEKIAVTPAIILRSFQTHDPPLLILHLTIAILFATNLVLVSSKISSLKKPSVKVSLGAGILSLTTAGCASCGLSLLSLLGIGGALTFLPFKGVEILLTTVLILTATLIYNLKTLAITCKI